MNGIEFDGAEVSRPAQDTFKMKKTISQQRQQISAMQAKLDHYEKAVKDAADTILALEEKIRVAEERLLKRAVK